jgi:hypothetical protein
VDLDLALAAGVACRQRILRRARAALPWRYRSGRRSRQDPPRCRRGCRWSRPTQDLDDRADGQGEEGEEEVHHVLARLGVQHALLLGVYQEFQGELWATGFRTC